LLFLDNILTGILYLGGKREGGKKEGIKEEGKRL
jgi:hypothetical protein